MRVYISGGCKNGKSTYAEKIAKEMSEKNPKSQALIYIATMIPSDDEDHLRIEKHRSQRRNLNFTTIEQPRDIFKLSERCDNQAVFLLDSVTALLANEMFLSNGTVFMDAYLKVNRDLENLLGCLPNIVLVSDNIFSDAVHYDPITEQYRKGLGLIGQHMAKLCEVVLEVTLSNLLFHKGKGELHL